MAEDAEEEEEEIFPAGLPVPLSTLRGGTRYSAWVQASNALGAARSPPRRLDLQELGMSVRPSVRPSIWELRWVLGLCVAVRAAPRCHFREMHGPCG